LITHLGLSYLPLAGVGAALIALLALAAQAAPDPAPTTDAEPQR